METFSIDKDITVFYISADSYPQGIAEAHRRLHELVPFSPERNYFGLSRPENGGTVVYRAAVEELYAGEAQRFNCDTLVLEKGNYSCITVNDYESDLPAIGQAFGKLLALPDLDAQGYCVEWYFSKNDVRCMVRLNG